MDDNAFFERSILASAAGLHDEDAVRQLRELFSDDEFAAWQAFRAGCPGSSRSSMTTSATGMSPSGASSASKARLRDLYEEAIDDLAPHVRTWATELRDAAPGSERPRSWPAW